MARHGGARDGSGRRPGSLNRKSGEVLAAALDGGTTPVEYMLGILRDDTADAKDRQWAAEKAAPFIHARPAPLERTIEIKLPAASTADGIGKALDRVLLAIATGELSPAEGQSLIAVIEARRKAIETEELLERIEKLEALQPGART